MKKKRIFNNCSIEDMEQLEGYTIDSVIAPMVKRSQRRRRR